MIEHLLHKADVFIQENEDALFADIKRVVDINSVQTEAKPGMPSGEGVAKALETALETARRFGLETKNVDGYMGVADLKGKSDRQIAVIAHLDVVPAGNGWDSDPFCMIEKDGYIIGRGTADDKGPAVVALYAAKFLREQGVTFPYTLRLLFGTSEETGMEDVDHYLAREAQPRSASRPTASSRWATARRAATAAGSSARSSTAISSIFAAASRRTPCPTARMPS